MSFTIFVTPCHFVSSARGCDFAYPTHPVPKQNVESLSSTTRTNTWTVGFEFDDCHFCMQSVLMFPQLSDVGKQRIADMYHIVSRSQ